MSRYYMYFSKTKCRETTDGIMIPENYNFWPSYICAKSSRSFNCFVFVTPAVYSKIRTSFSEVLNVACEYDNIKIFDGCITQEFIDELIHNPFDSTGKIRWFSIFLMNGEDNVLNCEHYGSEIITGCLEQEDIDFLKEIMPDDFTCNIFEEDKN